MEITCINNDGGGFDDAISVCEGATVAAVLAQQFGESFNSTRYSIKVNGRPALLEYVLADGDALTVTPLEIRGEAWRPKLQDFRSFLASLGMTARSGGKHDEVWQHPAGWSIPVKGSDSDRKMVDQACIRSLAKNLGWSFGQVLDAVRQ